MSPAPCVELIISQIPEVDRSSNNGPCTVSVENRQLPAFPPDVPRRIRRRQLPLIRVMLPLIARSGKEAALYSVNELIYLWKNVGLKSRSWLDGAHDRVLQDDQCLSGLNFINCLDLVDKYVLKRVD